MRQWAQKLGDLFEEGSLFYFGGLRLSGLRLSVLGRRIEGARFELIGVCTKDLGRLGLPLRVWAPNPKPQTGFEQYC